MSLSKKQAGLLDEIRKAGTHEGKPIPLYVENWSRADSFFYESERRRFLENMQNRGLIEIRNECFLSIPTKDTTRT